MARSVFPSRYKEGRIERDWTQGGIVRNLLSLSWPILVSSTINTIGPTVDMIWIGRLGSSSIAGVGVSIIAVQVANSLIMGLFTGTTAMVARFVGARDEYTANRVAQQAFVVGASFSILMAITGIFLAETLLIWLGVEASVVSEGAAYMRIQFVGMVTMSTIWLSQSIMQASGDALTPMKIGMGYRLIQLVLCPALVFGWWLFPHLGVRGAALSNIIAQGMGGSVALWVLFNGKTRLKVTLRNFHFDSNLIWRTVKIGIPASITAVERNFAALVLIGFIIPFGTLAVAAHALSMRIDQISQVLSAGFGTPAGVLAGQNLGAGQPDRAAKTGWLATALSSGISVICSAVIWFWVEPILRIFNSEPGLMQIAATFLRIQVVSYLVWGMVITLSQVLNGVGDTLIPMLTNMLTIWVVQMPLAYLLPRVTGLDVYGIRWSMVIAVICRAVIYPVYFKLGRWQRKTV
jgi:putative MATE family efflux protein